MSDERKVILKALGETVRQKRFRYEALGMQNVNGTDEVERARRSMAYAQAQTELWNAESALRAELERYWKVRE